ncbi:MAG: PhnA domain-containing protein [Bdellovibrionales bacterium]
MTLPQDYLDRSNNQCELCNAAENLDLYTVPPHSEPTFDHAIVMCSICHAQIDGEDLNVNHWRCLNESMWSEVDAVKVVAWRMLNKLKSEGWAQDLLDMMYLEETVMEWAQQGQSESSALKHVDSNGATLEPGDTVVLIKDLDVKGTSFTAKRGTAVRNISLVPDNAEHIEGRVNGQQIVILTKFVKKSK